jgi:hypothetical protein
MPNIKRGSKTTALKGVRGKNNVQGRGSTRRPQRREDPIDTSHSDVETVEDNEEDGNENPDNEVNDVAKKEAIPEGTKPFDVATLNGSHTAQNCPGTIPGTSFYYPVIIRGLVNLRPSGVEVSARAWSRDGPGMIKV